MKNLTFKLFFLHTLGTLTSTGLRRDVEKEFVLYTDTTDEGTSHYIEHNLQRCYNPRRCRKLQKEKDEKFMVRRDLSQYKVVSTSVRHHFYYAIYRYSGLAHT